jgi:hypothetical protein
LKAQYSDVFPGPSIESPAIRKQLLECKGSSFLLLLVFGDGVPDELDGWLIIV